VKGLVAKGSSAKPLAAINGLAYLVMDISYNIPKMKRLGQAICQLLEFHTVATGAQAYFASARLKSHAIMGYLQVAHNGFFSHQ
jgi:hypothetical protein